jgi:hypothetical protein
MVRLRARGNCRRGESKRKLPERREHDCNEREAARKESIKCYV